jgi:hypothetical protein
MEKDTRIIDAIMSVPTIKRRKLRNDAQRFAIAQCNGDYWYNEDTNTWEGEQAHKAAPLQQSIIKRIHMYSNGIVGIVTNTKRVTAKDLPDFISFENDPRGYVLKIETGKLSEEAKQYCRDNGLEMDWGGDYTILTTQEVRKLNKMNNK